VAPRAGLEEVVANIWAPLLGLQRVGAHDNFFELGGHSLLMIAVVDRLRRAGLRAGVVDIFSHPTVESLAARIREQAADAAPARTAALAVPSLYPSAAVENRNGDGDAGDGMAAAREASHG
jgi:aryl carrier-like protein